MSRRACSHGGPFRIVAGARDGHGGGDIGVMCMGCGAYQRPYPWTEEPGARPVPWYGEAVDVSKTPEGGGYALFSEPLTDRREAHRVAFEAERTRATERRDAGWFIRHGLLPAFWEIKTDEQTGDLLYREKT